MEKIRNCEQSNCPVKESGKCLEGLEYEECSHFYWTDSLIEEEFAKQNVESIASQELNNEFLFSGDELTAENIKTVTHKYNYNLIIIIGESESGKTTILSSIFDLFQIGGFQSLIYSGSLTQIGFEKRCHHSRTSSEGRIPETEKTKTKEFNFLHIAVKNNNYKEALPIHFLLSDISGERFQLARDQSSAMKELELIKEADHLIFLLDGKKLADKFMRTGVINNAKQFIKRAIDVGNFNNQTNLKIIVSKWDLLKDDSSFNIQSQIIEPFTNAFKENLKKLSFSHIAARPIATSDLEFGTGLEALLLEWMEEKGYAFKIHENENIRFALNYKAFYE